MPAPVEAIVVYDGTCGFCRFVVTGLKRRWGLSGRPRPWQSADLVALGLTEDDVRAKMWFVGTGRYDGARRQGGAAAFAAWLRTGTGTAARLGRLLDAPVVATLAAVVYRGVARYRRRIPGPWGKTCSL